MPDDKQHGLYEKYNVARSDGNQIGPHGCVVLEMDDPRTHPALRAWATTMHTAGYEYLAADVLAMISSAEKRQVVRARIEGDGDA